jgi:hypothetical protein
MKGNRIDRGPLTMRRVVIDEYNPTHPYKALPNNKHE